MATGGCKVIRRHNFLAQKLEGNMVSMVSVHCHVHRLASASHYTSVGLFSMVYETAKALSCNYGSVYCFTVAIGLPGDASDYNEDKRSSVAARMQNKVVVE